MTEETRRPLHRPNVIGRIGHELFSHGELEEEWQCAALPAMCVSVGVLRGKPRPSHLSVRSPLAFEAVLAAADNGQSALHRIQSVLHQHSKEDIMNFSFVSRPDFQDDDASVARGRVPKDVTKILALVSRTIERSTASLS